MDVLYPRRLLTDARTGESLCPLRTRRHPLRKNRYVTETKRLSQVLDLRLKNHDWLVGDKYSIADINAYPWLQYYKWAGLKDEDVPKSVRDYIDRNWERAAG